MQLGVVMEKNWVHSVGQWQAAGIAGFGTSHQFVEYTSHRCNGFARIQKAVVAQMGSRPQTVTVTFSGASFTLESALELLLGPATELVVASCPINSTFQHTLQSEKWFIVVA